MDRETQAELRKIEQELAKLSKLKTTKTTKQRKLKLTRRKAALQGQGKKPTSQTEKAPSKQKEKPRSTSKTENTPSPAVETKKPHKTKKERVKEKKRKRSERQAAKKQVKSKKTTPQAKAVPFNGDFTAPKGQVVNPLAKDVTTILATVDRIRQALAGYESMQGDGIVHEYTDSRGRTSYGYNGQFRQESTYLSRLESFENQSSLSRICDTVENEEIPKLINNDPSFIKRYEAGETLSNKLVEYKDEILRRIFTYVFDSQQGDTAIAGIDGLLGAASAFEGTDYESELQKEANDIATHEESPDGIERESYEPKTRFTGAISGEEYTLSDDKTIESVDNPFKWYSPNQEGKYLIDGQEYTLAEARMIL